MLIYVGTISGNLTVVPTTIKSNGVYSFIIDTTTIIPSGGYLSLTFPSQVILSSSAACVFQFGFTGNPACSASGNILKITNGFPSLNGMRFQVTPVTNPGSAQDLQNFIFKFYSTLTATTAIDTSSATTFQFQYTTDTLTSALISPSSSVVGSTADWTYTITPKNQIPAGGIIQLYFPKWNIASLYSIGAMSMLPSGSNTCNAVSGLTSTSLTCSFVINPISTSQDVLTITNAFATTQTSGSTFQITVTGVKNMPTMRPYATFDIWTLDANSYGVDTLIGQTVTMTTPATLPSSQVKVIINSPTTVDALTSYLFTLFINNPIPMGGQIRVKIPSQVGATQLTQVIAEQRINAAVSVSVVNAGFPNYVQLTGGYPTIDDSVPIAGLIAFQLQYLNNPSTSAASTSFQIETYDGVYPIEQITTGLIVAGTTGAITMNSFTYTNALVLQYNSFSIDMTLFSALQVGCTIEVDFPSAFIMSSVSTGNCQLTSVTGLSSASTCQITSNKLIISSPFGSSASVGGERIKFTIANNYIQNPPDTRQSSTTFKIQSVSQPGNQIDIWTGTYFQASANSFNSVGVMPSSYIAGAYPVTYTFSMTTPFLVEQNAQIIVKLPSSDVSVYDQVIASSTCLPISSLTSANFKCNVQSSTITATNGFQGANCACTGSISFQIGGLSNPRSLKPSGAFSFAIYSTDNYIIYQNAVGPTVTMVAPDTLTNMTVLQTIGQNGGVDSYLFTITTHNLLQEGDYIILTTPSQVTISNNTLCAARGGLRGFYSCVYTSPNQMKIVFAFSGLRRRMLGSVQVNNSFQFILLNIVNPSSMSPSGAFYATLYTTDGYLISNITNGPTIANTKPSNMSQIFIKPSNYANGQWTNLTFSIIPNDYIQYMTMTIRIADDMFIAQASPTLCQLLSAYTISSNMVCDYLTSSRTIRISNAFTLLTKAQYTQTSPLLQQLQFTIGQFINPEAVSHSGNFTFTTYDSGGYIIDSMNQTVSYVCSSLCGSCSPNDYTQCISCPTTTSYKLLYMGQCVQQCPTGTTQTSNSCLICPDNCLQCSVTTNACNVCKMGYLFLAGTCVLTCPVGYTLQAPSSCVETFIPPFTITSYFQKTDTYQCYIFPFSGLSILLTVILLLIICCSKCLVNWERGKLKKQNKKEHRFLIPLRIFESCIGIISLVEVLGWGFYIYCMLNVQENLPFYIICSAAGFNLFLNFIMTCGIMRSKENYCDHLQSYSESYICTYFFIKFFTLFISHKGFYFAYARYQKNRDRHSHFDFSYFDSGDEDGVSGLCFKFFFLISVLLLHGAVITACILNYMNQEPTQQLFCLDLDIMGMTVYQAFLVLLTLLKCGGDNRPVSVAQRVYPKDHDDDKSKDDDTLQILDPVVIKKKEQQQTSVSQYMKSAQEDDDELSVDLKQSTRKKQIKQSKLDSIPIMEQDDDDDDQLPSKKHSNQKPFKAIRSFSKSSSKRFSSINKAEYLENNYFEVDQQAPKRIQTKGRAKPRIPTQSSRRPMYPRKSRRVNDFQEDDYSHDYDQTIDPFDNPSQSTSRNQIKNPVPTQKFYKPEIFEINGRTPRQVVQINEDTDEGFKTIDLPNQKDSAEKPQPHKSSIRQLQDEDLLVHQKSSKINYEIEKSQVSDSAEENLISHQNQNTNNDEQANDKNNQQVSESIHDLKSQLSLSVLKSQITLSDKIDPVTQQNSLQQNEIMTIQNSLRNITRFSDRNANDQEQLDDNSSPQKSRHSQSQKSLEKQLSTILRSDEKQSQKQQYMSMKSSQQQSASKKSKQSQQSQNDSSHQISKLNQSSLHDSQNLQRSDEISKQKSGLPLYEIVSENASSDGFEEEIIDQTKPHFEKVDVGQEMSRNEELIVGEPSYKKLIDQIDHEYISASHDIKQSLTQDQLQSLNGSVKTNNDQSSQLSQKIENEIHSQHIQQVPTISQDKNQKKHDKEQLEQQISEKTVNQSSTSNAIQKSSNQNIENLQVSVQPSYEKISNSIPTVYEEQYIQQNNAEFVIIKDSFTTQNECYMQSESEINENKDQAQSSTHPNQQYLDSHQNLPQFENSSHQQTASQKQIGKLQEFLENQDQSDSITQLLSDQRPHSNQDDVKQVSSITSQQQQLSNKTSKIIGNDQSEKLNQVAVSDNIEFEENLINQNEIPPISYSSDEEQLKNSSQVESEAKIKQNELLPEANFTVNSIITPPVSESIAKKEDSSKVIKQNEPMNISMHSLIHQTPSQTDELQDEVNAEDIKPKTKIIFSDKSESSVEEMMEDTPSNYNVLNGRLEEDSRGLRSMIYKAISKKQIYKNDQSQLNLPGGNEDSEARKISQKTGERRYSSLQNRPPSGEQSANRAWKREEAKLFIQKAAASGTGFLSGSNLIQKEQQMFNKTIDQNKRNSSIPGNIPSSQILDDQVQINEQQNDPNSRSKITQSYSQANQKQRYK